jgi:acyl-CoA thioesterase
MDAQVPAERWPDELVAQRDALDAVLRAVPYRSWLGAELISWGPGWAQTRVVPRPGHANLVGGVHGGVVTSLADLAFEVACNSYGRVCVASSLTLHFTAGGAIGEPLTARAQEMSRTRRLASYRVDVRDARGDVVAWAQAVAFRTERWHLAESELPDGWREAH